MDVEKNEPIPEKESLKDKNTMSPNTLTASVSRRLEIYIMGLPK